VRDAPGTVVLDMNDRRPVWAMPDRVPSCVRDALPPGWTLQVMEEATDGSGDGAGRVSPAVLEAATKARIYLGYGIAPELLEAGSELEWVHSGAAGVGSSLTPTMKGSPVVFTNSAGIHAPAMAETVLGMILHFGRGLDFAVRAQARGAWDKDPFYRAGAPVRELSRMTVGIVGFGGIGRAVARRVAALGARVVGVKRTPPGPDDARLSPVGQEGSSLEARLELTHGAQGLERVLEASDVLILSAPETPETRGLLDAAALARLPDGALVINVGRGGLVVLDDLVAALRGGRLRGAALDVFPEEPLPEDHPLWKLPNVLLTPHVSAVTDAFWERETDLILHNLRCYLDGEDPGAPYTPWRNVVDKEAGY